MWGKSLGKTQYTTMIKALHKYSMKVLYPNITEAVRAHPQHHTKGENCKVCPWYQKKKGKHLLLTLFINTELEMLAKTTGQEKEMKAIQINEEIIIVPVHKWYDLWRLQQNTIRTDKWIKAVRYKVSIQKLSHFLYTNNNFLQETMEVIPSQELFKTHRNKFNKIKDL